MAVLNALSDLDGLVGALLGAFAAGFGLEAAALIFVEVRRTRRFMRL